MSTIECPLCKHAWKYDGDYEGFTQDSEHEFTCAACEQEFLATVYWDLCFTCEREKPKELDSKGKSDE